MKLRIFIISVLAMALVFGAALGVQAAESGSGDRIQVTVNGHAVTFHTNMGYPYVDEAWRTQVPLRAAMEAYGAWVDWDENAHTAVVQYRANDVRVPIGQNYLIVNGQIRPMDTQALIRDGRTYLPIRFAAEALGGSVTWDQSSLTVAIQNPSYPYVQTKAGTQKGPDGTSAYQNALLIGDSRTQGIQAAAGLKNADFLCENGLSLRKTMSGGGIADGTYTIVYEEDPEDPEGEPIEKKIPNTITLTEKLQSRTYSRVYLILGFNDVGWKTPKTFAQNYQALIDTVRRYQPQAMVIAELLVPVTEERSVSDANYNNPGVAEHNQIIREAAANNNILCVDPSWAVTDAAGALAAANSFDGIHLYASAYKRWAEYVGRIVP